MGPIETTLPHLCFFSPPGPHADHSSPPYSRTFPHARCHRRSLSLAPLAFRLLSVIRGSWPRDHFRPTEGVRSRWNARTSLNVPVTSLIRPQPSIQIFIYIDNRVAEPIQKSLHLESIYTFNFRNVTFSLKKSIWLLNKFIDTLIICQTIWKPHSFFF